MGLRRLLRRRKARYVTRDREQRGSAPVAVPVANNDFAFRHSPSPLLPPSRPSFTKATMSWFKRDKDKPLIPPVEKPASQSEAPSYRSTYGRSTDNTSTGRDYGDSYSYTPPPAAAAADAGQGEGGAPARNWFAGRARGPAGNPYDRGIRDLDTDRNELFAGAAPAEAGQPNRYADSGAAPPSSSDRDWNAPATGQEQEEDVEGIKQKIRSTKTETVSSTRNAIRIAREAEETGRATLGRLVDQSGMYFYVYIICIITINCMFRFAESLARTERHLDVTKGHSQRAEDHADEIKKLNRSIFIPAITFDKKGKRDAEARKREMRYQEELEDRERVMADSRETQNRMGGTAGGYGGYGSGQLSEADQAERKLQRKRFQFDKDDEDDILENELDDNLAEISGLAKNLSRIGVAMGDELRSQNDRIRRIGDKADREDFRIRNNTRKVNIIR